MARTEFLTMTQSCPLKPEKLKMAAAVKCCRGFSAAPQSHPQWEYLPGARRAYQLGLELPKGGCAVFRSTTPVCSDCCEQGTMVSTCSASPGGWMLRGPLPTQKLALGLSYVLAQETPLHGDSRNPLLALHYGTNDPLKEEGSSGRAVGGKSNNPCFYCRHVRTSAF